MRVTFKPYRRKDGSFMLYINNDRKVSVGVSPEKGFGLSKDITAGQRKLIDAAKQAFDENAQPFTGDIASHQEGVFACGPYTMAITDVANIGGMDVSMDGAYVIRDGKILRCGEWMSVDV